MNSPTQIHVDAALAPDAARRNRPAAADDSRRRAAASRPLAAVPPSGRNDARRCMRSTRARCATWASIAAKSTPSSPRSAATPNARAVVRNRRCAIRIADPRKFTTKGKHHDDHDHPGSSPAVRAADDGALREVHRSVQAHPLGHRPRRDPRPPVRLRPEVPARRPVEGRRARVPAAGRGALPVAGPGPDLRQHVRAGRALHRREDARARAAITGSATRSRSKRWCG